MDAELGLDHFASELILGTERLHSVENYLPDLFHVRAVFHADYEVQQFVGMVPREVLEVLVEERSVGESHHGAVGRYNCGALVINAVHLAPHAVAFHIVPHPQTAGH